MPIPAHLLSNFEENRYYHVICKSTDGRELFAHDQNRALFLDRYHRFLSDFINTYTYSMLTNHVNFLIQPKSIQSIYHFLQKCPPKLITSTHRKFILSDPIHTFHELIEQQFNRFFISYARTFNTQQNQAGHLFLRPFKRIAVDDNSNLARLCIYIHANPLTYQLTNDFTTFKWSSYQSILSDSPTHLCRNEVLKWFDGKTNFIRAHQEQIEYYSNHPYLLE